MYLLVDVDEANAGFDFDPGRIPVKRQDAVHAAHVKQRLAVVEGQITVAPSRPPGADRHIVLPAESQRFPALFEGCGTSNKGAGAQRSDQRGHLLPLGKARDILWFIF